MKVYVYHPIYRENPVTYLSTACLSGASSLKVKNTDGFATAKYAILGLPGLEQAEIVRPSVITSPDTFTLPTNTKFPHNADTKVTLLDFNQVKIYRSTAGINGTYTLLDTVDITIDAEATMYEDTNSQATYYYKFSYYNLSASAESDLSDPIAATGFVFYSLKTLIDRVLSLFGDQKGDFVTRDEVKDYLNEIYEKGQQEIAIATKRHNLLPQTFTVESNVAAYDLNADFMMEKAVKVSTDGGVNFTGNAVQLKIDSQGRYDMNSIMYGYTIIGNQIILDKVPGNSTDQIKVYYFPTPVTMNLQTDTLASPFQNSSAFFVRYALGMCYLKDKKFDVVFFLRS